MKLTREDSEELRDKYKLVRRDDFVDVPGKILEADEETGKASIQREETVYLDLGPGGFKILLKGR